MMGISSSTLQHIYSALVAISAELVFVALGCGGVYAAAQLVLRTLPLAAGRPELHRTARTKVRRLLVAFFVGAATVVLAVNGYILMRGLDPLGYTLDVLRSTSYATRVAFGMALVKLAVIIIGLHLLARLLRRLLGSAERALARSDHLKNNDRSIAALFRGLARAIVAFGWILMALFASIILPVPRPIADGLQLFARIYLVLAIGVLVIRSTPVLVDLLNNVSHRSAQRRNWLHYYEHLRPLLPTFRACLEYALWIAVVSFALFQVASMQRLAAWGPRLIQAIGVFFAGCALIELGHLEIGHRMLPREGLDETERRRRATMIPLVRSAFTYAGYFGTVVLMLSALGFNPMPFLAGAGLLGLVVGFGAQSLINDVVSGFFILFENIYLVGDMVEVGAARGVVEAIDFRTTKIRDADGRVHVIRNGDMKPIINYSKEYTMAVVSMEIAYDADLPSTFEALRYAGERLHAENCDVLEDTQVDGITAFGASTMTVRTSTRVRAGRHEAVAAALRLLIKDTLDRQASDIPRKMLVGTKP
jgi:small conductance mechanosensitive channel